jgi:hypothetical protein
MIKTGTVKGMEIHRQTYESFGHTGFPYMVIESYSANMLNLSGNRVR